MSTIDNMGGGNAEPNGQPGSGSSNLLPALRQGADIVARMRQDVESIERSLNRIGPAIRNTLGGNSSNTGNNYGFHSNGAPVTNWGAVPPPHLRPYTDSYAVAGDLGPGAGYGGGGAPPPAVSSSGGYGGGGTLVPYYRGALVPVPNLPTASGTGGRWSRVFGAVGTALGLGFEGIQHFANKIDPVQLRDDDSLFNRMRLSNTGSSFNLGSLGDASNGWDFQRRTLPRYFTNNLPLNMGMPDVTAGLNQLQATGMTVQGLSDPRLLGGLTNAQQVTGQNFADVAAMQAHAVSPDANQRGLLISKIYGIRMQGAGGRGMSFTDTLQDIYNRTGRIKDLDSSLQGGVLAYNLKNVLGIDQSQVTKLAPIFRAAQSLGITDFQDPRLQAILKANGATESLANSDLRTGSGQAKSQARLMAGEINGLEDANAITRKVSESFQNLYDSSSALARIFDKVAQSAGLLKGLEDTPLSQAHGFSQAHGGVGQILEGIGAASLLKKGAGLAGRGAGAVGGRALLMGGARVGLAAGITVAGLAATNWLTEHSPTSNRAVKAAGNILGDAGVGAAAGTAIAPGIGTVIGTGLGAAYGIWDSVSSWDSWGGGKKHDDGRGVLETASSELGTPYSWGGGGVGGPTRGIGRGSNTVGFDCSSFVQFVYAKNGVHLGRTTYDQVKAGVPVAPNDAKAGDLFFFGDPRAPHHVGIYMGNNKMIEAPHTGASIRIRSCSPKEASIIRRVSGASGYAVGNSASSLIGSTSVPAGGDLSAALAALSSGSFAGVTVGSPPPASSTPGSGPMGVGSSSSGLGDAAISGHHAGRENFGDLVNLARSAGFPQGVAPIMAAIALAETGGNPSAHNGVPPDNSYGLWQINMLGRMGPARRSHLGLKSDEELYDPSVNARAALDIWKSQGFKAWSTYTSGKYKNYLAGHDMGVRNVAEDHLAVVHKGEAILPADGTAQRYRAGASSGAHVVINMTVNSSGSPTDAERLAEKVAKLIKEKTQMHFVGSV